MIELIVFDLDGTLIDSSTDLANAANAMLRELGGRALSEEAIIRMVGEGAAVLVRRALTASGLSPDSPGALDRYLALYDATLLEHTLPYPGTVEMLEQLTGRYTLAVLTNKPARPTARVLEGLGLARFFDTVVGGDGPLGRKPDPAGLLQIARDAGLPPGHTLMVGDSPIDHQTARRAGAAICLARFGFGYTFSSTDLDGSEAIIDAPEGLLDRLAALGSPRAGSGLQAAGPDCHPEKHPTATKGAGWKRRGRDAAACSDPGHERPSTAWSFESGAQRPKPGAGREARAEGSDAVGRNPHRSGSSRPKRSTIR